MTKKSLDRLTRDKHNIPKRGDVVAINHHVVANHIVCVKKSMLSNQIYRDGPKIARSFDRYAKPHIVEASTVYAIASSLILRHLPEIHNDEIKPTVARVLFTALNSYTASIEAARHGYRRQFGILSRAMIEALALVLTLLTQEDALDKFHNDELSSAKCVSFGKNILPIIGKYYGLLSKDFVHIGKSQDMIEPPAFYTADQEALSFIINAIRSNIWLYYIVAEFAYHDECDHLRFWRIVSEGQVTYDPTPATLNWSDTFLTIVTPEILAKKR